MRNILNAMIADVYVPYTLRAIVADHNDEVMAVWNEALACKLEADLDEDGVWSGDIADCPAELLESARLLIATWRGLMHERQVLLDHIKREAKWEANQDLKADKRNATLLSKAWDEAHVRLRRVCPLYYAKNRYTQHLGNVGSAMKEAMTKARKVS